LEFGIWNEKFGMKNGMIGLGREVLMKNGMSHS